MAMHTCTRHYPHTPIIYNRISICLVPRQARRNWLGVSGSRRCPVAAAGWGWWWVLVCVFVCVRVCGVRLGCGDGEGICRHGHPFRSKFAAANVAFFFSPKDRPGLD